MTSQKKDNSDDSLIHDTTLVDLEIDSAKKDFFLKSNDYPISFRRGE
jgi:hypothetical protein